jgi:hypothetical protein
MRALVGWIALLLFAGAPGTVRAADLTGKEPDIKAAMLYKLLLFVDWPPGAFTPTNAPLTVAVLGDDPFGKSLEAVFTNRTVSGRFLQCRRLRRLSELPATPCHVLFVANSERDRLPEILAMLDRSPILTIGDTEGYASRGVMLNLVVRDRAVKFEANPPAATRVGLRIRSQLTELAIPLPGAGPAGKGPPRTLAPHTP